MLPKALTTLLPRTSLKLMYLLSRTFILGLVPAPQNDLKKISTSCSIELNYFMVISLVRFLSFFSASPQLTGFATKIESVP